MGIDKVFLVLETIQFLLDVELVVPPSMCLIKMECEVNCMLLCRGYFGHGVMLIAVN
jgi:hypothetical protein